MEEPEGDDMTINLSCLIVVLKQCYLLFAGKGWTENLGVEHLVAERTTFLLVCHSLIADTRSPGSRNELREH